MKKLIINFYFLLPFLLFVPVFSQVETIQVKVVGIIDGNTITVLTKAKAQKPIWIKGIDAPEKEQTFGTEARQRLTDLILNKNVVIEYSKVEASGEILGKVFLKGKDIGLEMIQTGFAWHDEEQKELLTTDDRDAYDSSAIAARRQLKGLWQDAAAVAPWEFKKNYKPKESVQTAIINNSIALKGSVVEVLDGATIALVTANNSRFVICINQLETPEPGQPKAGIAEQHLKDLLLQKSVRVNFTSLSEDEGCLMGNVYLNEVNINLQMVRDGVAWANKGYHYPEGYHIYEQAEQAARNENRGIWQDAAPMAPWEYRAQIYRTEVSRNDGVGLGSSSGVYGDGSTSNSSGSTSNSSGTVRVRGYYRSNGTYVRSHTRSAPGSGGRSKSSSGKKR